MTMSPSLITGEILVAAVGSLVCSTLTYSLRELSRVRLSEYLERRGLAKWADPTMTHQGDLVFVTAVLRLLCNTGLVIASATPSQQRWRPSSHCSAPC